MSIQFDDKKFYDFVQKKKIAGLQVVGAFVDGEIGKNINKQGLVDTSNMLNSRSFKVYEGESFVRCSVNTIYAAIQELGGEVVPSKRVGSVKRKKMVFAMEQLFWAMYKKTGEEKFKYLALHIAKGGKIRIPSRPFIRPAVYDNQDKILRIFARAKAA